ncbi:MAG TPA: proline racemase family protein, partial [Dongiaceae bacterium]
GLVIAEYEQNGESVESVRLTNVPGFLYSTGLEAECPGIGTIKVDVAYGGNFYAIVEPQAGYRDMADFTAGQLVQMSPVLRRNLNAKYTFQHPENPTIKGLSHILWTGAPKAPGAHARNAVFYGDKAIDRSPCGTGTSARMAQLAAKGKLKVGDSFVHESIIGSLFKGRVKEAAKVGNYEAIVPSVEGWARITGYNTIFIDDRDPYKHGFQVI